MTNAFSRRTRETLVLLTILQIMAALLLAATPFLAWQWVLGYTRQVTFLAVIPAAAFCTGFGVNVVTCICLWQRLKKERAFIPQNARALRRVAVCCVLCAVVLLAGPLFFGPYHLTVIDLLLAFSFAGLSVFTFALELLCRKAILIQNENDMTV